ncbi:MAG: hypothetical protein ACRDUX_26305 [Mycobacterium sp.]
MPVNTGDVEGLAEGDLDTVVPVVTTMAKAYTRGRGFTGNEPNRDIAAVIVTASARLAANGKQVRRTRIDDVEYEYALQSSFAWSLAEQSVLNRYRVQAQ